MRLRLVGHVDQRLHGQGKGGVVVQPPAAFTLPEHGKRKSTPLLGGMRPERGGNRSQIFDGSVLIVERRVLPQIGADPLQGFPLDHRPHVVQHQPADGQPRLRCQSHADQATHAGAHPINHEAGGFCAQLHEQRRQVGGIRGNLVTHGIGQPVALASPSHVHRDHTGTLGEGSSQGVKVAALTPKPMHTDHHVVCISRPAGPVPVGHSAGRAGTGGRCTDIEILQGWFLHGERWPKASVIMLQALFNQS